MNTRTRITALALLSLALLAGAGCSTTRSENGVTIEQRRSLNPLDYIPGF